MNNQPNQQGFALVTVLLLTLMASTLVLTSLQDSTVQERLNGNFQKKLNSRMMAEKGVYDAMHEMSSTFAANPNLSLQEMLKDSFVDNALSGSNNNMQYGVVIESNATDSSLAANEISVYSKGELYEGQAQIKAIFVLVPGTDTSAFPYADGITGCESVTVTGSGGIDSYDSTLSDYDDLLADNSTRNKGENATVRTLLDGAMTFTGAADIDGDLLAADTVTFKGAANISGNLHSNGDLNLATGGNSSIGGNVTTLGYYNQKNGSVAGNIHANGDITLNQTRVGGNVISRKKITITGQTISGYLLALNDISLTQPKVNGGAKTHQHYYQKGGRVSGGVRAVGNATLAQWGSEITNDDLRYAGTGQFTGDTPEYLQAPYHVSTAPYIEEVPIVSELVFDKGTTPTDSETITCDPYDIASEVASVDALASDAKDLSISGYGNGDIYVMSKQSAHFSLNNGSASSPSQYVSATSATFINQNYQILMYDDVTINGHLKVQTGQHVTMYVKGDFTMLGASSLTIPEQSSLTLIIQGALDIGAGGQVYTPDNGVTSNGVPVFSIYSAYSGAGITFSGGTEQIYAAVYAPLTDVEITSAVGFKGSVHGKTVTVSGAGGIHYDAALVDAKPGFDSGTGARFVFDRWQYVIDE